MTHKSPIINKVAIIKIIIAVIDSRIKFEKMKTIDNKKVDEIYIKETVECFKPAVTNL